MKLSGLHRICANRIHKHYMINSNQIHTCHDHCWNAWKICLGIVFWVDDEVCHIISTVHISLLISSVLGNQLLTNFVWILDPVNLYISGQIQSFKYLIRYLLGCRQHRPAFILLLWANIDVPTLKMYGLWQCMGELSCHNSFCRCWCQGMLWWPLADCVSGWSPKMLIVRFWSVISTIIVIVGYCAEIVIEILVVDRSSTSPGSWMKRSKRRSAAPSSDDF